MTPAAHADDSYLATQFQNAIGNHDPDYEDWSLHGQTTEILQGNPAFPASYTGPSSLSANQQWKNSTTATLFLGRRLWEGAEVYFDPEEYEGVGLSNSHGVAGFPNGEANKSGDYGFTTGDARLFLRQTIGFGGETEKIAPAQNQLATTEDINRLTVTVGKFAASDIFDANSYTHDPRTQFLNWSLMDSAAWDYPGNARGYTQGFAFDYNQARWALRYGAFLEPKTPNGNDLTYHGFNNIGQVAELEERHTIYEQAGIVRFLLFYNRNRAAYYNDAFALPVDINTAIAQARDYGDSKFGFAVNAEQKLTDTLGAFMRLSWNNGTTEEWMFTQVDESIATGLSLNGKDWGRGDDVVGLAFVANGISNDQKRFLEEGGQGIIIGDGQLRYNPELIAETYYAFKITSFATLTPDYQFIANPGYNSDRGRQMCFR